MGHTVVDEDGLARLHGDEVQHQAGDEAGVAGVVPSDLAHRGIGRMRGGEHRRPRDGFVDRLGRDRCQQKREGSLDSAVVFGGAQLRDDGSKGCHIQPGQQRGGFCPPSKADEPAEGSQRIDHLRFMERILEAARRIIEDGAGGLLAGKRLPSLLCTGVYLQRDGLGRGEKFDQKRKCRVEAFGNARAQHGLRVGSDRGAQVEAGRPRRPRRRWIGRSESVKQRRGRARVSTQPGFCIGLTRGCFAEKVGNRGRRSPRVVARHCADSKHAHPLLRATCRSDTASIVRLSATRGQRRRSTLKPIREPR